MANILRKQGQTGNESLELELALGLECFDAPWTVDDIGQKFVVRDMVSPVYTFIQISTEYSVQSTK